MVEGGKGPRHFGRGGLGTGLDEAACATLRQLEGQKREQEKAKKMGVHTVSQNRRAFLPMVAHRLGKNGGCRLYREPNRSICRLDRIFQVSDK